MPGEFLLKYPSTTLKKLISACILLSASVLVTLSAAWANQVQKVAILPFETHSQEEISYIKTGLLNMLETRLAWKEHTLVVESATILKALENTNTADLTGKSLAMIMAEKTKADVVLLGSVTEFSGAFSIDARIYDVETESVTTFFSQARSVEEIIPQTSNLAGTINHKIFNRKTALLTKESSAPEPAKDLLRANPEKLLFEQFKEKKSKPFWKFW